MRTSALWLLLGALLPAPAAHAALSAEAQQALQAGLKDLYDLNYSQSRADFHKLTVAEPDDPFGYLFEAGGIWWESSQEYGLFQDTPALEGLFEQDVQASIRTAGAWADAKDDARKADGNFALGIALGTEGQWRLLRRQWMRAYFEGKKAIKHLRKALKVDPEYYDVDLGLGVFDYQAAHMSGVLKVASALGGMRGDENRGLAELELALARSRYSKPQTAVFLASIYIVDRHDPQNAERYIAVLRQMYPESVYFQFLELALKQALGDWDGSLADGRLVFEQARLAPESFNPKLLTLVCGMRGPACLQRSDVAEAALWLGHAVDSVREPARGPRRTRAARAKAEDELAFLSMLHLYRGYSRDLLGQRQEAVADYRWVLAHPDFLDGHARARQLLDAPLTKAAFLSYLRAQSQADPPASE